MPNFNYGNERDSEGRPLESDEERGLREAREAFVSGGSVPEAALKKVFDDALERFETTYAAVTEEARDYLAGEKFTRDRGLQVLERLLYRHIYQCFHPKNRGYLLLLTEESRIPLEYREAVAESLERNLGSVLTALILSQAEVKKQEVAAVLSASLLGAVRSFAAMPEFTKRLFKDATRLEPNYAVIEDLLNNCLLRCIYANTSMNKEF